MCGIFGIISKEGNAFYLPEQNIFLDMTICGAVRGDDASGIFGVTRNGEVDYLKIAGNPYHLVYNSKYKDFVNKMWNSYNIVFGHNRKATQGDASNSNNAHPFVEKNTILIHNGTVAKHKELKEVEVDSHAILHSIVDIGYKETLKKLDGAFALVWYSVDEDTLYLCRNAERPLFIAETDKSYIIASEKGMLSWLINRNFSYSQTSPIIGEIKSLEVGKVYKFFYPKDESKFSKIKIEEESVSFFQKVQYKSYYISGSEVDTAKKNTGGEVSALFTENTKTHFQIGGTVAMNLIDYQIYKERASDGSIALFRGSRIGTPEIEVICLFKGETKDIEDFVDCDYLSVIIKTIVKSADASRVTRLVCSMPVPATFVYSRNFNALTIEDWLYMDKSCNACGKLIEFKDIKDTIIKFSKTKSRSRIRCKSCMEKIERKLDE